MFSISRTVLERRRSQKVRRQHWVSVRASRYIEDSISGTRKQKHIRSYYETSGLNGRSPQTGFSRSKNRRTLDGYSASSGRSLGSDPAGTAPVGLSDCSPQAPVADSHVSAHRCYGRDDRIL